MRSWSHSGALPKVQRAVSGVSRRCPAAVRHSSQPSIVTPDTRYRGTERVETTPRTTIRCGSRTTELRQRRMHNRTPHRMTTIDAKTDPPARASDNTTMPLTTKAPPGTKLKTLKMTGGPSQTEPDD